MPEITVRALAEFSTKPIADQMRILAEQKRPNAGAAPYRVHYYQSARAAIDQFFRRGNDPNRINLAIGRVQASTMAQHKKNNNERALRSFLNLNALTARNLAPARSQRVQITLHTTDVRLFSDLTAVEGGQTKYLLFNFSANPLEPELARRTLELMQWLLNNAGVVTRSSDVEYVDLAAGVIHTNLRAPRSTILNGANQNLQVIAQLWPII